MPARLLVGRWSGTLGSETSQADSAFSDPENIGARWSLDGFGTQRIEVLVKPRNKFDAYDRYNNHLGQRIGLYSHWAYKPISGFITSVEYAGGGRIQYIAKGPSVRMTTEYDKTVYADTLAIGGASGAIQSVLANMPTRMDDTTTSNIATNTATLNGTNTQFPQGTLPKQLIQEILSLSDTSNNIYDFWFVDQPFNGTQLQLWTPYYQARSDTASIDWQVDADDLQNLKLSRNIDDIITDSEIFYSRITGTQDGGNNAAIFTDTSEDFLAAGVTAGDSITNIDDGSRGQVEAVTTTTITPASLSGGTDDDFDNGDFVDITLKNTFNSQTASTTATYWKKEHSETVRQFDSTQASRWATAILEPDATQVQAFTITSPWIRDGNGARHPLWEVIVNGGGYIRVNDLFPAAALFSTSRDNLSVFKITALDYDYTSNTLRVNVDNTDRRLDARLRRAGIVNSELVSRA